jgi:hypothetical protein
MRVLITSGFTILLSFWLLTTPSSAQLDSEYGISVVPAISEYAAVPGVVAPVTVSVTNTTPEPLALDISVRSILPSDEPINPAIIAQYDGAAWITPDISSVLLSGGETRQIPFTLTPPADAGPGGHYAQLIFRIITNQADTAQTTTQIAPEVSSVVLLNTPGNVVESADATLREQSWLSLRANRELELQLANNGNIHLLPQILYTIKSGDQIIEQQVGEPRLVLPNTITTYRTDWTPNEPGIYTVAAQISYGTPIQTITTPPQRIVVLPAVWISLVFLGMLGLGIAGLVGFVQKRLQSRQSRSFQSRSVPTVSRTKLDQLSSSTELRDRSKKR